MKTFDLEEAKKGKPVVTREGRSVRIICWDCQNPDHPIVALVSVGDGTEKIVTYSVQGIQYSEKELLYSENPLDLFMEPIKKEGWINVYRTQEGFLIGSMVRTTKEEEEDEDLGNFYGCTFIGTSKIEWEE